jgi:hypothetical protein
MITTSRSIILSAALLVAPVASALAQQNNPTGNYGSNRSATASSTTADTPATPGMRTGDISSASTPGGSYGGPATSSSKTGATGQTVVPGNNSTVAGDTSGTAKTKTGGATDGNGK